MSIYITYLQSHVQYKSWPPRVPQVLLGFPPTCPKLVLIAFGCKCSWCWVKARHPPEAIYIHIKARFASQDVVDGPGSGALRCAGLWVRAAGGEAGCVSKASRPTATGLHRGQAVHDTGQALQTGRSGCFIIHAIWWRGSQIQISQIWIIQLGMLYKLTLELKIKDGNLIK